MNATSSKAQATPRPKAYSYVRFSTPEQAKGDSFRRQSEAAIAYCQKEGLELDTSVTFHDLGVSAFKGKNAETGALKAFLKAAEDGHIPKGSFLLVESLDRISRASIVQAQTHFMSIICAGITLVTLGDGRVYSEDSINANPTDFFISLVVMMRGNDESATKSRRLKAAWSNKRVNAKEKKLYTSMVPGWLRVSPAGNLEPIPDRADIVQRIYAQFLGGKGRESIARELNADGVEVWGTGKRKGKLWHTSYITKILDNPAVIGTLTNHTIETVAGKAVRKPAQEVAGYYPQVIDEATFARVRAIRDTATVIRTKGSNSPKNILAGLCVCHLCGSTMTRVTKASAAKPGKPYLVCTKAKAGAGCTYKAVGLDTVEVVIRQSFHDLSKVLLSEGSDELANEVEDAQLHVLLLEEDMDNITEAIAKQGHSPALAHKLQALEAQWEAANEALVAKRVQLFNQTHAMRRARIDELGPLLADHGEIAKTNILLRELLRSVTINYETGYLHCKTKAGSVVELMYKWID